MPPPPRPPGLPDELVEEVLVRVPPEDPRTLARAALACRRWRGLVADPDFRRRRLDLHGAATPPMLGFLCDGYWDGGSRSFARFVPTSPSLPPRAGPHGRRAFDARHGRALLHGIRIFDDLAVWDPVTDQLVEVPRPPGTLGNRSMKATVLCAAAAAAGACDHLDCHRGPFAVVAVGTNEEQVEVDADYIDDVLDEGDAEDILQRGFRRVPTSMFACVYSSESGAWGEPTYAEHPDDDVGWERSALAGNALYFALREYDRILRYDLGRREMSMVRLPPVRRQRRYPAYEMRSVGFPRVELTTMEDGRLGFARVEESNELRLWSRGEDEKGAEGWTLRSVIDLKMLFPLEGSNTLDHCLVGFVEGVGVALVAVRDGVFTVDTKSGLVRKVSENHHSVTYCVVPYFYFCTPALGASSTPGDDGPRVGTSP